ncbi:helix-turn-helix domain-containing protein [Mycolicibacterium fortuitum]|nr:helix-turn-helix domain-containing protein [Mycolicibacterium fortuitum]
MAEETTGAKSTGRPLGATGDAVRKNIRRIRDDKGISAPELSEGLKRLGRPIPPLGISRIENGQRRVDVDDLMAISIVLGVSPTTLLMTPTLDSDGVDIQSKDDLVSITGWHKPLSPRPTWLWIGGEEPLVAGTEYTFYLHAWPRWWREERLSLIKFPGEDGHTDGDD